MSLETVLAYLINRIDLVSPELAARLSIEILFRPRKTARSNKEKAFWLTGKPITFKSGCCGRILGTGKTNIWIIHGWMSRGSKLQNLITACLETGSEVIVWDGPGHGDSPGNRTSLAPFTKTLLSDINNFEKKPDVIIGHSFGGAASAYACQQGLSAKLLVLISAPSSCVATFERYWDFLSIGDKARKRFMEIVEKETGIEVNSMSSVNFISDLRQKVLVIHDSEDRMVPLSDAYNLRQARPDIEFLETTKLGHNRVLHDKDVCSRVSKFIRDNLSLAAPPPVSG